MELIDFIKKNGLKAAFNGFPKTHSVAASALLAALLISFIIPTTAAKTERHSQSLTIPSLEQSETDSLSPQIEEDVTDIFEEHASLSRNTIIKETVRSGDSLSTLFKRAGLSDRIMMNFMHEAGAEAKRMTSLIPGHNIEFAITDEKTIASITYIENRLSSYSFSRQGDSYSFKETIRTPDVHKTSRSGEITQSLYLAGMQSGLDDKLIMQLAEIFGWDIDFALDIRKGDKFKILYEENFIDGEKLNNGAVLSAIFINQGQTFSAVRYVDEEGRPQYYSPDGKNMRKAFLRAPVDFRRISDGFNPRRLHPVTKNVRPHRGIDYAANTGTPVWSSGDGKVIRSGYTKANGNYIVIQHGNNVQTKYLHLSKRHVKVGARVRQKQIIGKVGATGLVTGPHLHYEFLLNGVHRNPRTILQKLPKAESIPANTMPRFLAQTQPLMAQLIGDDEPTRLALSSNGEKRNTL